MSKIAIKIFIYFSLYLIVTMNQENVEDLGKIDFVIGIKFEECNNGYIMVQGLYYSSLII